MGSVVLVRHGEAEGNQHHRLIGWSDVGLTSVGQRQAELVADRLSRAGVDRIVTSDLRRTVQTAMPLAEAIGIEPIPDPRLREIHNGEWTGLTPVEVSSGWPEIWQRYVDGSDVDRPGGERWADVRTRVVEAMTEHLARDGLTVVFSHGGPLVIAASWASGVTVTGNVFKGPLAASENASLCTIVTGPRLLGYNDVGHLRPVASTDVPYAPVTSDEGADTPLRPDGTYH
jgi:probable phosphoglycerate mutase